MARKLSTADARRDDVLEAAVRIVAEQGLQAPTTAVAKAAGISHAYLFRLFPTKTDLALALMQRMHDRVHETFSTAATQARAAGEDPVDAMGAAYTALIQREPDVLKVQLQGHAAAMSDPVMRDCMRSGYGSLVEYVATQTEGDAARLFSFFATGMLLNVLASMDALELDEPWAQALLASQNLLDDC